jgi:7-cyano-7-deazaguanine synthase
MTQHDMFPPSVNFNAPALVVLSGGQDSVTCLGLAIEKHGLSNVKAIGFKYGQQHSVEIECATDLCREFGIEYKVIDISFLGALVTSALTGEGDVSEAHPRLKDLPASFVPNRNALFLTIAHAFAQEFGAESIYTGVCQTDYSGYPDCREIFIGQLNDALNTGYQTPNIQIITPLMYLTKAETFDLANEVGFLDVVLEQSHTCYNGNHETVNEWGYGCGECPACELRAKGFKEWKEIYGG